MFYEKDGYLHVTMHEFKSNISRLTKLVDRGLYQGVVVMRYKKPVAMFLTFAGQKRKEAEKAEKAGAAAAET